MKKIKLLFLLLLSSVFLHGQEYIPMLKENRVWSVTNEKFAVIGDTIINELNYKKLYFHNYIEEFTLDSLEYLAAMREDSISEKVFLLWKGHEEEVLLYDFSIELGSEISINSPYFNYNSIINEEPVFFDGDHHLRSLVVTNVYTEEVSGALRRIIELESTDPSFSVLSLYWINGLGSVPGGVIYSTAPSDLVADSPFPILRCIHDGEELIYFGEINLPWMENFTIDNCYAEPSLDAKELISNNIQILAYPSFFQNSFTIQSNSNLNHIIIVSELGQKFFNYDSVDPFTSKTIYTSHWPKGLYIIVAGNGVSKSTVKIIKK